ncbi:3-oxoacyl-ACP reductase FabG [Thiotrichales bacterium 19S3-7]|nr:3-oxoacyl-ACP reductase FabG [Thiotrichales bacterium 19S3-7]MCF6801691.1 3-oxoacyl-ACP reductase FabG [Thiotrichales bacterium 19S3-11]
MFDLSGKTALVTGASRGIGQGISDHLAQHGAYIIGTATTDDGAGKITQRFDQLGVKGHGVKLNIADDASINELLKQLKTEAKAIDILVNNAGITRDNLAMRLKDEQWDEVINTNLSGVFKLTRGLLRDMMKKRWGRIITIGSVVGSMGNPGQANYCAAKAAVIGVSKSLAHELASRGITANVIAPGFIKTDMTADLNEAQAQAIMNQVPTQSMGNPQDIAAATVYLASNEAGYVTGHTLHVNGGLYMA